MAATRNWISRKEGAPAARSWWRKFVLRNSSWVAHWESSTCTARIPFVTATGLVWEAITCPTTPGHSDIALCCWSRSVHPRARMNVDRCARRGVGPCQNFWLGESCEFAIVIVGKSHLLWCPAFTRACAKTYSTRIAGLLTTGCVLWRRRRSGGDDRPSAAASEGNDIPGDQESVPPSLDGVIDRYRSVLYSQFSMASRWQRSCEFQEGCQLDGELGNAHLYRG